MLTGLRRPNNLSPNRRIQAQEGVAGVHWTTRSRQKTGVRNGQWRTKNRSGVDCQKKRNNTAAKLSSRRNIRARRLKLEKAKGRFISNISTPGPPPSC